MTRSFMGKQTSEIGRRFAVALKAQGSEDLIEMALQGVVGGSAPARR